MLNVASKRARNGLGYLALAALALQAALGVTSPGLAAWSPSHVHLSLDGHDHAHVHLWEPDLLASAGDASEATGGRPLSEPAPANDRGLIGGAVAIPAAAGLVVVAALVTLAPRTLAPALAGVRPPPTTPPPRG